MDLGLRPEGSRGAPAKLVHSHFAKQEVHPFRSDIARGHELPTGKEGERNEEGG
jgi:hypothetical protein